MIQLIVGEKGKGKTKVLLDKVNTEVKTAHGSIVYLDKSTKHMYELNNKVRLIDVSGFDLASSGEFVGFIYGILSQDHDLEQMYLDSFLKISMTDEASANALLEKLAEIGEKFNVTFVISISVGVDALSEKFKENIIAEL
ncbi:MAG: twitching motility protein PilT [Lachnospiraceae bacterium]|nr:twitching motility protein PilT [Lachnospiraceae bacterium]